VIVYKATNNINGKIYIGYTTNSLEHRKRQHISRAKSKHQGISLFHLALRKYGPANFSWVVIDSGVSRDELILKEEFWINFYKSSSVLYNLRSGGAVGSTLSNDIKRQISIKLKNRQIKDELKRKVMCVDTGEVFDSLTAAAKFLKTSRSNIRRVLDSIGTCKGLTWITIKLPEYGYTYN